MYTICNFLENIIKFLRMKIKILYWKLKYGKRIKIGRRISFRKKLIINISKNGYLEIGDNNFFNNYCSINCHKKIKIGNDNLFGENVKIYDHSHIFNDNNVNIRKSYKDREIYIGNGNWFGSNVTLLSKSKIGNKNVVGANVVINEVVENDTLINNVNEHKKEEIIRRN